MLGDSICRRFCAFVSLPHRFAAAVFSGLLVSSWLTYLGALLFMRAAQPLLWGNLLFFILAAGAVFWLRRRAPNEESGAPLVPEAIQLNKWDWILIGIFFVAACALAFGTFNVSAGEVQIANHQWSDFGSTVSVMQSFALGHNFPTELPHYSGERIRYHFLFYFQAGNLEYLGLNPAYSNNILSVLTLVSMLVLVMTLGIVLFRSRAVGRIGAALFFFHGSLAYIPFLRAQESYGGLWDALNVLRDFLPSGYPYRGELWGVWSQVVFLNQRHLASSIGILLLVLIFVVTRYQAKARLDSESNAARDEQPPGDAAANTAEPEIPPNADLMSGKFKSVVPFVFFGALLGLLPMWNSAVFTSAFAVLALLFLLFPLKKQMLALAATTGIFALPQVIFLKTGNVQPAGYSLFHWGYTIDNPTIGNVIEYLGFTFGFKWVLIAVALVFATWFQKRVLIAVTSLIGIAFCFRFSEEVLANHKFLNVWLVIANLFVAYGLCRLWKMRLLKTALPGKIAALLLTALIVAGGIIDFFPIRNGHWIKMPFEEDRLVRWVREETDPKAVFLSDRFVNHSILLAGRRLFHGHPYYAHSAGYPTHERDVIYKRMFDERDPKQLLRLLHENNISYVAIDNGVRKGGFIVNANEAVFKSNFEKVFQDTENRYGGLIIFKVPADLSEVPASLLEKSATVDHNAIFTVVNAFEGGLGKGHGQFDKPRGIAVDMAGNFYVADLGNARVQKFSPEGDFLAAFGQPGTNEGELREPNGITVDSAGSIYVADALNHRLIKFRADGTFEKQWDGPAPGFYGPRDVRIGADKQLYVFDQGRDRVVKLDSTLR